MKLYLKILSIALFIIIGVNIYCALAGDNNVGVMFLWLLLAIAICGLSSVVIMISTRLLPDKLFSPYRRRFKVYKKENKLYTKLKVKKWKDKVPELGKIGGFAKNKINEPNNPKYIFKFLTETCIAEALHFYSILAGGLLFIFIPSQYLFTITIPIFLLNGFLHLMPVIIQRYIRPKFLFIYQKLLEQEVEEELKEISQNWRKFMVFD